MGVARDINRAIQDLAWDRLVVALRGNTGGGIGYLRLMSHLCADRPGVGYSVSREVARKGYANEKLPAFDRIPSSKLLSSYLSSGSPARSDRGFTETLGFSDIMAAWRCWSTSTLRARPK